MSWTIGHIAEKNNKISQMATLAVFVILTIIFSVFHKFEQQVIDDQVMITEIEIIDVDITQQDVKNVTEPTSAKIPIAAEDDEEIEEDYELEMPDTEFDASTLPPPPPAFAGGDDEVLDFFAVQEKPQMTAKSKKKLAEYIYTNYPPLAKKSGVSGTVVLRFTCSKEGLPVNISVFSEKPKDMGFAKVAIEALKSVVFSPGIQRDRPVAVSMKLPIRFTTKKNR